MSASPRIGIDARLTYYRQGGIAQYTQHLIRELAALDTTNRYLLLHSRKDSRNLTNSPNQQRVACWTPSHHRFERWALALEVMPLRLDLLHNPDFIPPRNGSADPHRFTTGQGSSSKPFGHRNGTCGAPGNPGGST